MGKLYVFGDSYSTPDFCVDPGDSWWGLMSQALSVDTIENYSWCGNNIDSIAHVIVSDLGFCPEDYVVIGIPPVERSTLFDPEADEPIYHKFFNNLTVMDQCKVNSHSGLKHVSTHQLGKEYVMHWNRSWAEAQMLRQIFLLKQYVLGWTQKLLIVNLAEPFQPKTEWPPLANMQRRFLADPHCILFSDTYYSTNKDINRPVDFDTHGWHGHHGPSGNLHWYQTVLRPRMETLGWL